MTIEERARRYITKMPEAISGQHGHSTMFNVACVLMQGFSLDMSSARALLGEYNNTLTEPFTQREMEHKLKDAARAQSTKGTGYLLNPSDKPIRVRINPRKPANTPPKIIHRVVFGTGGTGISYGMTKTIQTNHSSDIISWGEKLKYINIIYNTSKPDHAMDLTKEDISNILMPYIIDKNNKSILIDIDIENPNYFIDEEYKTCIDNFSIITKEVINYINFQQN